MADPHTTDAPQPDTEVAPGIVTNPARRSGRPTIKGTRITVDDVLDKLYWGGSIEGVQNAYPHLSREAIQNAIHYAYQLVRALVPELSDEDSYRFKPLP